MFKRRVGFSLISFVVSYMPSPGTAFAATSLDIVIDNLENRSGSVCVNVFDKPQGFPGDPSKAIKSACYDIAGVPAKVTLADLKPGTYAVAVIHDRNKDGKLNTGMFGIPKEGFGFSNNPAVRMGPPKFDSCAFALRSEDSVLKIQMKNM